MRDGRLLRQNLWPVLTLAVPGALLGSLVIGVIVWAVSPLGFAESWLLGAILSSTDPIAVVGIFRKIGAPARLTMLVEGESLLNDATTIVLSRILLGVIAVGTFGATDFAAALRSFEELSGQRFRRILMVGGGARNRLLCQATADAAGLPLHAYALEGTAVGNLASQLIALRAVRDLPAFRALLAGQLPGTVYLPRS